MSTAYASRAAGRTAHRPTKVIRPPSFSPLAALGGIADVYRYRDLLITLTIHRIKVRYKQSMLGIAWAVVQPLALMLIYTVIFSVVTRMPSDGTPYPLLTFTGLLPWTFFSTTITNSSTALVTHSNLITKVFFPRELLPLTYVFAAVVDFLIACVILGGMMAWYHVAPNLDVLWTIPILFIAGLFSTALSLVLSATQVRFRDIGLAIPLVLQIWMFACPVVYPLSAVPLRLRWMYDLNPMVGVVENFRRVVLHTGPLDVRSLLPAAVISVLLLPLTYVYFKHVDATMADVI